MVLKYRCPDCGLVREYPGLPPVPPTCCGFVMQRVPNSVPTSVLDADGGYSGGSR